MNMDEILFVNFYTSLILDNYEISSLPSKIKDISGSILEGYNIGINKNISDEKKEAVLTILNYIFSKEFHKEILIKKYKLYTPLMELYEDDEVCSIINCEMMKKTKFIVNPLSFMKNFNLFSKKALKYFYEYIDGKKTAKETLNSIEDIFKIYYFSTNLTEGRIMCIILIFLICTIILSIGLIFIPKYKNYYKFLTPDLWIIYSLGSLLIIVSNFKYFNLKERRQCLHRYIISEFGFGLILIPILYKLLISIPKINKFIKWMSNNKYKSIFLFLSIHIFLSIIISISSTFNIKEITDVNDKIFYICCYNDKNFGKIMTFFQYSYNTLMYITICGLIFFEWNFKKIRIDIKHFSFTMILNGISQIINVLLFNTNIKDYILYYVVHIGSNLMFVFINHIYIIILRIIVINISNRSKNKQNEKKPIVYYSEFKSSKCESFK